MHPFEQLMAKKKKEGKKLSETEKEAKTSVLDNLMSEMDNHDGEKLGSMKKQKPVSPSKKDLDSGLDSSAEVVSASGPKEVEDLEDGSLDESEEELSEEEQIQELERKIHELQERRENKYK